MKIYKIICPRCHNKQKMITKNILKAKKACVYCNKSFKIYSNINKNNLA